MRETSSNGLDQLGHVGGQVSALGGSWRCLGVGQSGKGTEQDREQLLWPTCLGVNKRCITFRRVRVRTIVKDSPYGSA